MRGRRVGGALAAAVLLSGTMPAWAGSAFVSELRLGVLAHDVGVLGGRERGADFNGEILFVSPFTGLAAATPGWLRWALTPQPDLGVSINSAGYTSQGYGGLTWCLPLLPRLFAGNDAVTFSLGAGGEVNDGTVNQNTHHRKALGSNVLFRLSAELGYRVTERVGLYLLYDHVSNAGLAAYNESINDIGVRVGLRF